jgi:hypothetical protein
MTASNGIKRKVVVYVDKVYSTGQYRVQMVEHVTYATGNKTENFLGKRTFNMRKDADAYAKQMRQRYRK